MSIEFQYIEGVRFRAVVFGLALAPGAFAQPDDPKIAVNLDGFRYPVIARMARIEGDVALEVSEAGSALLSSKNPLLTQAAQTNLKSWTLPRLEDGSYRVTYHFIITGVAPRRTRMELVGDPFDRFFLRLLHAPTQKAVPYCDYTEPTPTAAHYTAAEEGRGYVVHVFVTSLASCLSTETAY